MSIHNSEIQELKEFITNGFNSLNGRVDKLEDGLRGNEIYPGVIHKVDTTDDELKQLKDRIDLDDDDMQVLKSVIRGARNWKLIIAIAGTLIGALAGVVLWMTEIIKNVSTVLGK